MEVLKKLMSISLYKTIRFNLHYFSRGVIRPYVLIARSVELKNLQGEFEISEPTFGCVKIGFPTVVLVEGSNRKTVFANSGRIIIDKKANFGRGTVIRNKGRMMFGEGFSCTGNTQIICSSDIVFGKQCLISWDVLLMDDDQHRILDDSNNVINKPQPIVIGDDVWIGCRVTVLKGAEIPNGNVVAAGSLICGKHKEPGAVITSEKKVIRRGVKWKK